MTKKPVNIVRSDVPVMGACAHRHRTGEFTDGGYTQTCDECGAETTNEIEGAEAEAFMRRRRGELPH